MGLSPTRGTGNRCRIPWAPGRASRRRAAPGGRCSPAAASGSAVAAPGDAVGAARRPLQGGNPAHPSASQRHQPCSEPPPGASPVPCSAPAPALLPAPSHTSLLLPAGKAHSGCGAAFAARVTPRSPLRGWNACGETFPALERARGGKLREVRGLGLVLRSKVLRDFPWGMTRSRLPVPTAGPGAGLAVVTPVPARRWPSVASSRPQPGDAVTAVTAN